MTSAMACCSTRYWQDRPYGHHLGGRGAHGQPVRLRLPDHQRRVRSPLRDFKAGRLSGRLPHIEQLPLVLVEALDLNIEDSVGIEDNA